MYSGLQEWLFHFHLGYWRICRQAIIDHEENLTAVEQKFLQHDKSVQFTCLHKLSMADEDDLTSFSIAGGAIASILLSIGLMQFICVVDDEMNTRLKPTSEGEPSKYKSYYGSSFLLTAMSFMLLQLCALNELHVFLQLYSASEDKLKIVPGLNRLLQKSTARLKPLFFIPEESDFAVNSLQLNSGDAPWKN
ncbi:hypothetical protein D918_00593 [Trichuris suis]|nr:hypothetical protein D918_00593 [Trichuris suis]